jgi:Raf kinase inhibitor-like YbhB/YbcL family protein
MSDQHASLRISSPTFDDGERIPRKYGRNREDINPPLRIEGVPDGARSLALLVEDPDAEAVADKVWTHWLVYDVPADRTEIPEDWDPVEASQGRTDFDETAYGGPSPPSGEHTYVFRVYALSERPTPFDPPTTEAFQRSIRGSVLAETELRGTYPAEW